MPNISITEGGGGGNGSGSDSNCSRASEDAVEVCLELARGNLRRNVSVNVKTISSMLSPGKQGIIDYSNIK